MSDDVGALECWTRGDPPPGGWGGPQKMLLWRIRRIERRQWHMATAQVVTLIGVVATFIAAVV